MKSKNQQLRSPITVILGHVDSGKTSLLDKVRGTAVQDREAGGITQHIGASFFPLETVKSICGSLISTLKTEFELPGILIVDTPGHAAFMNLRQRGASVADFAILVIDVRRGVQPQTIESINILTRAKVPFLIAANKIDRLPAWQSQNDMPFSLSVKKQPKKALEALDKIIFDIMGNFTSFKVQCDRFDRINDYTKQVAIVPTSALTGEGIPELFLILTGLAQQFLQKRLTLTLGKGKGSVLEVKDEVGLGTTLDIILFDGIIRKDSQIVTAGINGPVTTFVRALLQPKPLDEIRDPRDRFTPVKEVIAAAGVKIAAPNLGDVIAGAPVFVVESEEEKIIREQEIEEEISHIRIATEKVGLVLKADTLGALEGIVKFLQDQGVEIRIADIGHVTRRDVVEASIVKDEDELSAVVLAFHTDILSDAEEEADRCGIPIFKNEVIYRLYEDYQEWVSQIEAKKAARELEQYVSPAKIRVLPYVFRQSKPAVVGVEVLTGRLTSRVDLINADNKRIGTVLQIQSSGESIKEAKIGEQVAVSIRGPTVGRQIKEGDELFVNVPQSHAKRLQELRDVVPSTEFEALEALIEIKRRTESRFWALAGRL
ncbi:MAG: translation initiation factor IF-2 [Promethearchaeota archaeon]